MPHAELIRCDLFSPVGFILGYLYQFCMILQSSFLFHPLHRNKFWTLLLELGVIPHSVLIAIFFANGDSGSRFQVCLFLLPAPHPLLLA